jgi:hypothetical protein
MTQLPVRYPGTDSQSRGVRVDHPGPGLARCHRAGLYRTLQGRGGQKRHQHASLLHVPSSIASLYQLGKTHHQLTGLDRLLPAFYHMGGTPRKW